MIIPDGMPQAYLSQNGMQSRLAMLESRLGPQRVQLAQVLDMSLEATLLFGSTPLPASLQATLVSRLDDLSGPLVVRAAYPGAGPENVFLQAASGRAAVLDALRAAWARAWTPSALLERFGLSAPGTVRPATWPLVEVLEESALDSEDRACMGRRFERFPDGALLELAPGALRAALDEATTRADHERIAALALYIRYRLGSSYNNLALPHDPFGFLDMLLPGGGPEAMLASYASLCRAAGLHDELEYVELARRSMQLETETEPAMEREHELIQDSSLHGNRASEPQQLVGSPASPGRASGTLRRVPAPFAAGTVLACRRFTRALAALQPVAVLERGGGRIGAGALRARAAGLPCVSGIADLSLLPEGSAVMVDGGLGLVTVMRYGAARSGH